MVVHDRNEIKELCLVVNDFETTTHTDVTMWHFNQLHQTLPLYEAIEDSKSLKVDENMSMIYISYADKEIESQASEIELSSSIRQFSPFISPSTNVLFIYRKYRAVVSLDASPSAFSIDSNSGILYVDLLFNSFQSFVRGLVDNMQCWEDLIPAIDLTVIVQGNSMEPFRVLIQGLHVSSENTETILSDVKKGLYLLEREWTDKYKKGFLHSLQSQEDPLTSTLKHAVFCLNSLSVQAAPILFIITDGISDLSDLSCYDNEIMQLSRHGIHCHVYQLGNDFSPHCSFGFVPDSNVLFSLATKCKGTFFNSSTLQKAISYSSKRSWYSFRHLMFIYKTGLSKDNKLFQFFQQRLQPNVNCTEQYSFSSSMDLLLWREKVLDYKLTIDIRRLIEARIREGFYLSGLVVQSGINNVEQSDPSYFNSNTLLFRFLTYWHSDVWVEYIFSVFPNKNTNQQVKTDNQDRIYYRDVHVRIDLLANTDFIRLFKETDAFTSHTLMNPIHLREFISDIQNVDKVLLHLVSAILTIQNRDTSSSTKRKKITRLVSSSMESSAASPNPVFDILANLSLVMWHRWFHIQSLEIFYLETETTKSTYDRKSTYAPPNIPSPSHSTLSSLHFASTNRKDHNTSYGNMEPGDYLLHIIEQWSTFQLSKTVFVKLLSDTSTNMARKEMPENEIDKKVIQSFCFIRIEQEMDFIFVIHVAFFATHGSIREHLFHELKQVIFSSFNLFNPKIDSNTSSLNMMSSASSLKNFFNHQQTLGHSSSTLSTTNTIGNGKFIQCSRQLSHMILHSVEQFIDHPQVKQLLQDDVVETFVIVEKETRPRSALRSLSTSSASSSSSKPCMICESRLCLPYNLSCYLWHSKWFWKVPDEESMNQAIERMYQCRLKDGFWPFHPMPNHLKINVQEMEMILLGKEVAVATGENTTTACFLQYAIRRISNQCISTSFWMEPQSGFIIRGNYNDAVDISSSCSMHTYLFGCDQEVGKMKVDINEQNQSKMTTKEFYWYLQDYLFEHDLHVFSTLSTFYLIQNTRESIEQLSRISHEVEGVIGSCNSLQLKHNNILIIPPFSTRRLLTGSIRTTEKFSMYLQSLSFGANEESGKNYKTLIKLSSANLHLYSMLEYSLRALSDCEVAWTDLNGYIICEENSCKVFDRSSANTSVLEPLERLNAMLEKEKVGEIKQKLRSGKCFAKIINSSTILLAFLPSLKEIIYPMESSSLPPSTSIASSFVISETRKNDNGGIMDSHKSFSVNDLAVYQEEYKPKNYREGYKTWRLGGFEGSIDKQKHEWINSKKIQEEDEQDTATYGDDHHVGQDVDKKCGGSFHVAFYECNHAYLSHFMQQDTTNYHRIQKLFQSYGPSYSSSNPSNSSSSSFTADRLLASSKRFRKKIKRAHENNFSRGVYISLRDGNTIEEMDLNQALNSCIEIPTDFDISLLYGNFSLLFTANSSFYEQNAWKILNDKMDISEAWKTWMKICSKTSSIGFKNQLNHFEFNFILALQHILTPIPSTNYFCFTGNEHLAYDDNLMSNLFSNGEEFNLELLDDNITSIPSQTTSQESLSNEEEIIEDAEVEKEIAAIASELSSPFFLRFELKEINLKNNHQMIAGLMDQSFVINAQNSMTQRLKEIHEKHNGKNVQEPSDNSKEEKEFHLSDLETCWNRLILRFVLLTLPNEHVLERSTHGGNHFLDYEEDEKGSSNLKNTNNQLLLSNLSPLQRTILKYLQKQFKVLMAKECLMSCFTLSHPLNQKEFLFIQKYLQDLETMDPCRTTKSFHFNLRSNIVSLQEDFHSNNNLMIKSMSRHLSILELFHQYLIQNPYFYIECLQDLLQPEEKNLKKKMYLITKCTPAFYQKLLPSSLSLNNSTPKELKFYGLIQLEKEKLSIQLYLPNYYLSFMEGLLLSTQIRLVCMQTIKYVNQSILLFSLHETRTANVCLILYDNNHENQQDEEENFQIKEKSLSSHDKEKSKPNRGLNSNHNKATSFQFKNKLNKTTHNSSLVSDSFFYPGQFECNLQHSITFTLPKRLSLSHAVMISHSTLQPFQVHNRRNYFVYQDQQGHVFYMKMISKENYDDSNEIILHLYGVEAPLKEVCHELKRIVQRKLDEANEQNLSKLISRNVRFQLTFQDQEFLMNSSLKQFNEIFLFPWKAKTQWNTQIFQSYLLQHFQSFSSVYRLDDLIHGKDKDHLIQFLEFSCHSFQELQEQLKISKQPGIINPIYVDDAMNRSKDIVWDVNKLSPVYFFQPSSKNNYSCSSRQELFLFNLNSNFVCNESKQEFFMNNKNKQSVGNGICVVRLSVDDEHLMDLEKADHENKKNWLKIAQEIHQEIHHFISFGSKSFNKQEENKSNESNGFKIKIELYHRMTIDGHQVLITLLKEIEMILMNYMIDTMLMEDKERLKQDVLNDMEEIFSLGCSLFPSPLSSSSFCFLHQFYFDQFISPHQLQQMIPYFQTVWNQILPLYPAYIIDCNDEKEKDERNIQNAFESSNTYVNFYLVCKMIEEEKKHEIVPNKRMFYLMKLSSKGLKCYLYNLNESFVQQFSKQFKQLITWFQCRQEMILYEQMISCGFQHCFLMSSNPFYQHYSIPFLIHLLTSTFVQIQEMDQFSSSSLSSSSCSSTSIISTESSSSSFFSYGKMNDEDKSTKMKAEEMEEDKTITLRKYGPGHGNSILQALTAARNRGKSKQPYKKDKDNLLLAVSSSSLSIPPLTPSVKTNNTNPTSGSTTMCNNNIISIKKTNVFNDSKKEEKINRQFEHMMKEYQMIFSSFNHYNKKDETLENNQITNPPCIQQMGEKLIQLNQQDLLQQEYINLLNQIHSHEFFDGNKTRTPNKKIIRIPLSSSQKDLLFKYQRNLLSYSNRFIFSPSLSIKALDKKDNLKQDDGWIQLLNLFFYEKEYVMPYRNEMKQSFFQYHFKHFFQSIPSITIDEQHNLLSIVTQEKDHKQQNDNLKKKEMMEKEDDETSSLFIYENMIQSQKDFFIKWYGLFLQRHGFYLVELKEEKPEKHSFVFLKPSSSNQDKLQMIEISFHSSVSSSKNSNKSHENEENNMEMDLHLNYSIICLRHLKLKTFRYESNFYLQSLYDMDLIKSMTWAQHHLRVQQWIYDLFIYRYHSLLVDAFLSSSFPSSHLNIPCEWKYNLLLTLNIFLKHHSLPFNNTWNQIQKISIAMPISSLPMISSLSNHILMKYIAYSSSRYGVQDLLMYHVCDTITFCSMNGRFRFGKLKTSLSSSSSSLRMIYSVVMTVGQRSNEIDLIVLKNGLNLEDLSSSSISSFYDGNKNYNNTNSTSKRSTNKRNNERSWKNKNSQDKILDFESALKEVHEFVDILLKKSIRDFYRDVLWAHLLKEDNKYHQMYQQIQINQHHQTDQLTTTFKIDAQQLNECRRLSICTPLNSIDPKLKDLLQVEINWNNFISHLRILYQKDIREYQFGDMCHVLILCVEAEDFMIHIGLDNSNHVVMETCRREAANDKHFTPSQKKSISKLVNCLCHWLWKDLLSDV